MPSLPDPKTTKDQITKIDIGNTGRDLSGNVAGRDIFQKITQVFSGGPDLARNQRNRQAMLKLVKDFWVKGVLEKSLHGKILIELQMEARQDAVEHPWEMVLQMSDQVNQPLPFGTKIIDVFDDANQALLILGAPGSGKTTMLLELARDTIFRAEKDESQRMPVVFNLSSWTGQTIAEWLLEELSTKYNIPKKIARPWLENDEFLLLFDGLDEVALDRRNNCVEAINIFHQDHLIPLAVCSRIADYEALSARLKLHTAVLLQPLTDKQIEDYLTRAGVNLTAVQQALQHDASLYQLAQSPLMLSVMTLAYQGVSIDELPPSESIEERRQHVFSTYVQQMFKRRQVESDYSPKDTVHWLAWLAQNLSKHAQTIFVIERMQPSWLTSKQQQIYILITHLLAGLLGGFCGGMLGGAGIGLLIETNQLEPFGVFLGGFLGALIGSNWRLDKIKPVEILKWSWATTRRRLVGGLIFGSCIGLGGLAIFSSFFDIELGLFVGWTLAAIGISLFMLIGGLISEEIETRIDPNQGIWQSLRNSLVIGVVFGFVFFGAFELYAGVLIDRVALLFDMYVTSASRQFILYGGGVFGLILGLLSGLRFGGFAVLQHFVLRAFCWKNQYLPWHYARFLDLATERIFLQKVGGGYIYVHRLLLEYFESLTATPEKEKSPRLTSKFFLSDLNKIWRLGTNFLLVMGIIIIIVRMGPNFSDLALAQQYNSEGNIHLDLGEYELAKEDYDKAIELSPNHSSALINRGRAYSDLGNYPLAFDDYNTAIELDPSNERAFINRGHLYYIVGNFSLALDDYNSAIHLDPTSARAYSYRGLFYADMGNYELALVDYNTAIDLDPNFAEAFNNRGIAYLDLGDYEQALNDYRIAIDLDPTYANAFNGRGFVYYEIGNFPLALENYNAAIELDSRFVIAIYNRGSLYLDLGNYALALDDFNLVIDLDPNFASAFNNRGLAQANLGNYEQALDDYIAAIDLEPNFTIAFYNRGSLYSDLGNYELALDDFNSAIDLDPNNVRTYNNRGRTYAALGNYELALDDYNTAVNLDPNLAIAFFNRGLAHTVLGKYMLALDDLETYLELAPNAADRDLVIQRIEELMILIGQ